MSYPPYLAAALSGATVHQLSQWRRETASGAVLIPEVSRQRPIPYSFRDVVALRTCVRTPLCYEFARRWATCETLANWDTSRNTRLCQTTGASFSLRTMRPSTCRLGHPVVIQGLLPVSRCGCCRRRVLRHVLPKHRVDHVNDLGWSTKKDIPLLRDASAYYQVFVTNDANQFDDPTRRLQSGSPVYTMCGADIDSQVYEAWRSLSARSWQQCLM